MSRALKLTASLASLVSFSSTVNARRASFQTATFAFLNKFKFPQINLPCFAKLAILTQYTVRISPRHRLAVGLVIYVSWQKGHSCPRLVLAPAPGIRSDHRPDASLPCQVAPTSRSIGMRLSMALTIPRAAASAGSVARLVHRASTWKPTPSAEIAAS